MASYDCGIIHDTCGIMLLEVLRDYLVASASEG